MSITNTQISCRYEKHVSAIDNLTLSVNNGEHMAADQGPFYRELGRRLQNARKAAKMNQERIANIAGLTRTSVTNIEKGRQPIQVEALWKIANALKISILNLIPESPNDPRTLLPSDLAPEQLEWVNKVVASAEKSKKRGHHGTAIQGGEAEGRRTTESRESEVGASRR